MQIRQLAWHKYDFIAMGILATGFFCYSIAVLVSTARGQRHTLILTAVCTGFVACANYALARCALCP
jgi:Na+/H+ antiporter NhaD/arsenite permease-like protein